MSEELKNGWHEEVGKKNVRDSELGQMVIFIYWWVFYQNGDALKKRSPRKEYPLNKSDKETGFRDNNHYLNHRGPG